MNTQWTDLLNNASSPRTVTDLLFCSSSDQNFLCVVVKFHALHFFNFVAMQRIQQIIKQGMWNVDLPFGDRYN